MHSCLARRASLLLGKLDLALCWLGCGSLSLLLALRGELGRLCSCPTQAWWQRSQLALHILSPETPSRLTRPGAK